MARIAIVGSRGYCALIDVAWFVSLLPAGTVVVSGGAKGVDTVAVDAARSRGLDVKVYWPNWKKHGKAAGFIRNSLIVGNCDALVAFWDMESKGTKHSISEARKCGKPTWVWRGSFMYPGIPSYKIRKLPIGLSATRDSIESTFSRPNPPIQ